MTTIESGTRVRLHPRGTQGTGVGPTGTVLAVMRCESSITGALVRWTRVDVQLDGGGIVSREPHEMSVLGAGAAR